MTEAVIQFKKHTDVTYSVRNSRSLIWICVEYQHSCGSSPFSQVVEDVSQQCWGGGLARIQPLRQAQTRMVPQALNKQYALVVGLGNCIQSIFFLNFAYSYLLLMVMFDVVLLFLVTVFCTVARSMSRKAKRYKVQGHTSLSDHSNSHLTLGVFTIYKCSGQIGRASSRERVSFVV